MSSKLSPAARASIRSSLSAAITAAHTPGTVPNPRAPDRATRRVARAAQISESDLVRCLRTAITEAEALDQRPQRPMVTGTGFEPDYRDYQRRCDRFSCFVACLSGSLSIYAPEAAAEIVAFLEKGHAGAPVATGG